ncbi:NAD(P)H:quinone oxidoreductase [Bradyrhizobium sp. 156]|uniref:NAD(P)H:quinone oxidoreductase n=1 Tax=Bradyrhizobium sp. 156 TaxID=2782630 RepID=UPI001FFAF481|nr:NAD(P)H:quinone oxidoreductase [Bradyrhizobium sp. 156]MCK1323594.1 NAD(P)H:quinone oxidoreductase [Bradyrhizobium sp. 156]
MSKVLILYYSSYGHIEEMAHAVAAGVLEAGGSAAIKRVPELVPEEIATQAHFKLDQSAPYARIEELADYDAIILGVPTRFGRLPAQMAAFLDQGSALWVSGALIGKVGSAFACTATQHGGQETTLFSAITNLMHFGMVIAGLPYSFQGQMGLSEIHGLTPYGATTICGADGKRSPSEIELAGAHFQGRHVAQIASRLAAPI